MCACVVRVKYSFRGLKIKRIKKRKKERRADRIMSSSSPSTILSRYTINSPGTSESVIQSDDENVFCNEDNVQECAAYLNQVPKVLLIDINLPYHYQELELLGVSLVEEQEEPSIVRLLNIAYELIQYNRSTARKMDDITNRYAIGCMMKIYPLYGKAQSTNESTCRLMSEC